MTRHARACSASKVGICAPMSIIVAGLQIIGTFPLVKALPAQMAARQQPLAMMRSGQVLPRRLLRLRLPGVIEPGQKRGSQVDRVVSLVSHAAVLADFESCGSSGQGTLIQVELVEIAVFGMDGAHRARCRAVDDRLGLE